MNARIIAWRALQTIYRTQAFADEVVDAQLRETPLSPQDSSLAFELVYGVLRHALTLDWRLNHISQKPMARLPLTVASSLRLAAYQLLYLDRIPESAAVNESVKLIRAQPGHDWGGLVNAVLRNLIRQPPPPLPDVASDPVQNYSIRYACPVWMVQRWVKAFGHEHAEEICRQTLAIPPITLRANTLRCTRKELLDRLHAEGYSARETAVSPVGVTLAKCGNPGKVSVVQEGWCYVEDEAAQLIPPLLDVQPGHLVLDVCAAPGGKTTHLAQLMSNRGRIIALDRQQDRLDRLMTNCKRLGIKIVRSHSCDIVSNLSDPKPGVSGWPSSRLSYLTEPFDRILVDAPCSGLGVLRRHPEGKVKKDPSVIEQSRVLQGQILDRVCRLLRPGGILVYSACSVEPEETTDICRDFCRRHPEFHQESLASWVPANGHVLLNQEGQLFTAWNPLNMDGFFACRFIKHAT